jgi:hypothetical protein
MFGSLSAGLTLSEETGDTIDSVRIFVLELLSKFEEVSLASLNPLVSLLNDLIASVVTTGFKQMTRSKYEAEVLCMKMNKTYNRLHYALTLCSLLFTSVHSPSSEIYYA